MSRIKNEKIKLAQQNGQAITLNVSGDEFYSRYENDDGYTVVYDTVQGLFCYANIDDALKMGFRSIELLNSMDKKGIDYSELFPKYIIM